MSSKKLSQNIYEYRLKSFIPKSPTFYAILFVAIFLFVYVDNVYSNSAQFVDLIGHETVEEGDNAQTDVSTKPSTTNNDDIFSTEKKVEAEDEEEEDEAETEIVDPLIPPKNVSREERIAWFRSQLPELQILKSSSISQQFHSRVVTFLNGGCTMLFFIIWLSPAQSFGKRDFLTMDTLFKAHPQGCLLIISKSMDSKRGYRILKPLLDRGFKVYAVTPDLPFLVKNTPAEAWLEEMNSGNKDPGYIPLSQNLANLIRLAMLYKYGGVYMDTDIIVVKNFSGLRNAIGAQSVDPVTKQWDIINNAVMVYDINHPIVMDFIKEFASTFDGNRWGYNGPFLVTRVIKRVGNKPGYNLTISPPEAFYPVDWLQIGRLFKKPGSEAEIRWVESKLNELCEGQTYAVHLWNKRSRKLDIEEGSVMAKLVSNHCVVCGDITKP
ncbi:hypothetical protein RIF29_30446 [Crotalaria pallida]|uniref:Alpha 1,4-glycosyltransferase domain-containing protein n=1 Tax=Crotalaria pallida TaxID=3830 RepID=A0AAN9EG75_CROPI